MGSVSISEPLMPRFLKPKWVQAHLEEIGALAGAGVLYWLWPHIIERFAATNGWSASGLYSAVFGWTSIQVGILFGIYTFVVPRTEPFFRALNRTSAFGEFKDYLLVSCYLTMVCVLGAFLFTVVNPVPDGRVLLKLLLISWLDLIFYTVLRFLKIMRVFQILERSKRS